MATNKKSAAIDTKLEYLENSFERISHKRTERYVLQRIWDLLGYDEVLFEFQYQIKLLNGKYALADLYLPQINVVVEVNEPFHQSTKVKDDARKQEMVNAIGASVYTIDCSMTIAEIHKQIDTLVKSIRVKVDEAKSEKTFKPWDAEDIYSPQHYRVLGKLSVQSGCYLRTIDDICALFGTQAVHRGYLRAGSAMLPNHLDVILWWPNPKSTTWKNDVSSDEDVIIEYPAGNDLLKCKVHAYKLTKLQEKRITFIWDDSVGMYRFIGIFEIDGEETLRINKAVWRRTMKEINLADYL